ncbi:hypothetical protein E2P81_ATG03653 [Venturia nashicola]|nr:hypothetical protein E2P81_ATG03653 [Venturia nashicola]
MSAHSPPLLNAILALSCAHLEYKGIFNEEKSLDIHTRALQELGEAVKNNEATDETLAAIVMLIYYEVLVHRGSSSSVSRHLRGALGVIQARPQNDPSPTNRFLQRALNFFDTITALSFGTAPQSQPATPGALSFPFQYPPTPSVDTLLGILQYHAKATLAACLRVVMYEGPLAAILWPLFIGACEAFKEVDRVVARTAFRESVSRQGFQNIEQAWEVVEEVWRRSDEELREVAWEEVCHERGVNIVFG